MIKKPIVYFTNLMSVFKLNTYSQEEEVSQYIVLQNYLNSHLAKQHFCRKDIQAEQLN